MSTVVKSEMHFLYWVLLSATLTIERVHATSIFDVCTASYVSTSLPEDITYLRKTSVVINHESIQASPVTNNIVSDQNNFPDGEFDYCNVTFSYTHYGRNDSVPVAYWLPAPNVSTSSLQPCPEVIVTRTSALVLQKSISEHWWRWICHQFRPWKHRFSSRRFSVRSSCWCY